MNRIWYHNGEHLTSTPNCVICKKEITPGPNDPGAYGHSADPIARGTCCDGCHADVLVARIRQKDGE